MHLKRELKGDDPMRVDVDEAKKRLMHLKRELKVKFLRDP